jgi:predicted PurR-regulated permease PerM
MIDSGRRPDALIGGVVGGTLSVVCGVVVVIVLVKLCRHWRQRKKAQQIGEITFLFLFFQSLK